MEETIPPLLTLLLVFHCLLFSLYSIVIRYCKRTDVASVQIKFHMTAVMPKSEDSRLNPVEICSETERGLERTGSVRLMDWIVVTSLPNCIRP
jgi:hypothetical protein